jgi:4-amino-4-deoxychorismate lyase
MYPLFESICIEDGQIQHGKYHELRFKKSYVETFKIQPNYSLFDGIHLINLDSTLKYKLRIDYKQSGTRYSISEYHNSIPTKLKLIKSNSITYPLKNNKRKNLNHLYKQRGDSDDVLIVKNGLITDASYSNILFTNGHQIVTPSTPLLQGTCRARLLSENKISAIEIQVATIDQYHSFQLINALNDFDEARWVDTKNIVKK